MIQESFDNPLTKAILLTVDSLDTTHTLSIDEKTWMTNKLVDFTIAAANKFIQGKEEHGGDIHEIDLISEAKKEVIDLLWYLSAAQDK